MNAWLNLAVSLLVILTVYAIFAWCLGRIGVPGKLYRAGESAGRYIRGRLTGR